MLENMKKRVCAANRRLKETNLVTLTWGNVSEIDREKGLIVIKPSGVAYDDLTPDDMVVIDLFGNKAEGELNPSSDTPTHLYLYNKFPEIGGITHTHSRFATVFSQAQRPIPMLGTTHADTFATDVPCTRTMTPDEINGEYERDTGKVIAELFEGCDPMETPAALVASHGPFSWGKNADDSVDHAIILEEVAVMAWHTIQLGNTPVFQTELRDKHYNRKHGKNAYYGQKK